MLFRQPPSQTGSGPAWFMVCCSSSSPDRWLDACRLSRGTGALVRVQCDSLTTPATRQPQRVRTSLHPAAEAHAAVVLPVCELWQYLPPPSHWRNCHTNEIVICSYQVWRIWHRWTRKQRCTFAQHASLRTSPCCLPCWRKHLQTLRRLSSRHAATSRHIDPAANVTCTEHKEHAMGAMPGMADSTCLLLLM